MPYGRELIGLGYRRLAGSGAVPIPAIDSVMTCAVPLRLSVTDRTHFDSMMIASASWAIRNNAIDASGVNSGSLSGN